MKTAISIPDRIFRQADRLARRLGLSRSRLYARAVEQFIERQATENVTERLNAVYGPEGEGSQLDPELAAYQARKLKEWTDGETW